MDHWTNYGSVTGREALKLVAFERDGPLGVGLLEADGRVRPYRLSEDEAALAVAAITAAPVAGRPVPLADVTLALDPGQIRAPFPKPVRNIFCVGKNYYEHAHEFARSGFDSSAASGAVPEAPIIFSKVPECVTGPGAPILFDPAVSSAIDYEAELCV